MRYSHPGHAPPILDQGRDLRGHTDLGARLRRGLGQDRIEQQTAHRGDPADVAPPAGKACRVLEVLQPNADPPHEGRTGCANPLCDAQALQERHRVRLKM